MLRLAKDLRAQSVAHAQARHHLARHLGGALQVVAGASGDVVAEQLLGSAAGQQHGNLVQHAVARAEEVVLLRQLQRVAQRLSAADDADLVHRVGVLENVPHKGMAALVVGDGLALLLGQDAALALGSSDDALHGLLDLVHRDVGAVAPRGQKRGLVHEIHEVGAREARRELGQRAKVDVAGKGLALGVHADYLLAALDVGAVHRDLPVEAAGTQKRWVQDVGAVGGSDEDHGLVLLEAVHLHQQLVERLLALVVPAAQARAALAAHRIDLVDEDDGGSCGFGLLEEVTHAACAHAHEHLHEVRARDGEERHAGLARHGLGQKRLARSRRAHEQHASRDARAQLVEALGLGQEVTDLLELLDGLVHAGHVPELHLGTGLLGGLGLGLAKVHGLAVLTLHLAHEVDEHADEDHRGQHAKQDGIDHVVRARVHRVGDLGMLGHEVGQVVGAGVGALEAHERVGVALVGVALPVGALDLASRELVGERGHAAVVDGGHHVARGDGLGPAAAQKRRAHGEHEVDDARRGYDEVDNVHAGAARLASPLGKVVFAAHRTLSVYVGHVGRARSRPGAPSVRTTFRRSRA